MSNLDNLLDESYFLAQVDLAGLEGVASLVGSKLQKSPSPFVLWIQAPMGAGKTTLTAKIFQYLGLDSNYPVLSPTYTYINEYKIGSSYYAHLDLYRLKSCTTIEDLGIDYKDYQGFIIEWPSLELASFDLQPTHILSINYTDNPDQRRFYLKTC